MVCRTHLACVSFLVLPGIIFSFLVSAPLTLPRPHCHRWLRNRPPPESPPRLHLGIRMTGALSKQKQVKTTQFSAEALAGEALTKMIEVKKPYQDLSSSRVFLDDNTVKVSAVAHLGLGPSSHHSTRSAMAEATRHMSILGSVAIEAKRLTEGSLNLKSEWDQVLQRLAASTRNEEDGSWYYPVKSAVYSITNLQQLREIMEHAAGQPSGAQVQLVACCHKFSKNTASATVEMYCSAGSRIAVIDVEYFKISSKIFLKKVAKGKAGEHYMGQNPYQKWMLPVQISDPRMSKKVLSSLMPLGIETEVGSPGVTAWHIGTVDGADCLGHFESSAAMPVSILVRFAEHGIIESVEQYFAGTGQKAQADSEAVESASAVHLLTGGRADAHNFAWAGETLVMVCTLEHKKGFSQFWTAYIVALPSPDSTTAKRIVTFSDFEVQHRS